VYRSHLVDCTVDRICCQNGFKILMDPLLGFSPKQPHNMSSCSWLRACFSRVDPHLSLACFGPHSDLPREYEHPAFARTQPNIKKFRSNPSSTLFHQQLLTESSFPWFQLQNHVTQLVSGNLLPQMPALLRRG
jgi:hypothetical protein